MSLPKKIFIALFLVALIIAAINLSKTRFYKHETIVGTTFVYSDETKIEPFLNNFSKKQNYYLVAEIRAENKLFFPQAVNNFIIPFTIVLSGNGKKSVTIIRQSLGKNIECTTNLGENTVKKMNGQECRLYFKQIALDEAGITIYAMPENNSTQKSFAMLKGNAVIFYPKKTSDLQKMSLDLLRFSFPNTDRVVRQTRETEKYLNILK